MAQRHPGGTRGVQEGAGFRICWLNRDYRTIIAVAKRIPENVLEEGPKLLMWYDQALTRSGEGA
jgi:hypothetical protein